MWRSSHLLLQLLTVFGSTVKASSLEMLAGVNDVFNTFHVRLPFLPPGSSQTRQVARLRAQWCGDLTRAWAVVLRSGLEGHE